LVVGDANAEAVDGEAGAAEEGVADRGGEVGRPSWVEGGEGVVGFEAADGEAEVDGAAGAEGDGDAGGDLEGFVFGPVSWEETGVSLTENAEERVNADSKRARFDVDGFLDDRGVVELDFQVEVIARASWRHSARVRRISDGGLGMSSSAGRVLGRVEAAGRVAGGVVETSAGSNVPMVPSFSGGMGKPDSYLE
jgi:hypothetical protein